MFLVANQTSFISTRSLVLSEMQELVRYERKYKANKICLDEPVKEIAHPEIKNLPSFIHPRFWKLYDYLLWSTKGKFERTARYLFHYMFSIGFFFINVISFIYSGLSERRRGRQQCWKVRCLKKRHIL